ncbi:hypothetical protein BT93_L1655 [Corymbia citriodora subsp. variegata]|uniref:RRM domain-containing protein n=1 Tax=Corymbia citriodora subsp. variegata TaxID=360336 RepID=A0A8T0CXQ7_CORYI|nr:hypothetical protein BT93_L1655 [Corymbia citriodora subsp. variegata]
MSTSSLSMSAPPSLCNKAPSSALFFATPRASLPCHFPPKPPALRLLLALKSSASVFGSLKPISVPRQSLLSAAFDGFEAEDGVAGSEGEDPEEAEELLESSNEEEEGEGEGEESGDEKRVWGSSGGRLYVGNLPYSMNSSQLAEVFEEAGRVVNVEVVYDRVTDRSRGFAFVTMGSVEEAQEAIRMFDGSQVGGRTVKVNFPEVPKGGEREVMGPRIRSSNRSFVDSPHKIYAGNLGWGLTSQGLRDAFADQPGLLSAKVIYDRSSGKSRGFGFVSFESAEAVESALDAMNGVEVEGRPLRLNLAADRASPASLNRNAANNLDSSELLSSISS